MTKFRVFFTLTTILALEKNKLNIPNFYKIRKSIQKIKTISCKMVEKIIFKSIKNISLTIKDIENAINENDEEDYTTIDEYLEYMKDDNSYAGQIDFVISNLLKKHQNIHQKR